MAHIKAKIIKRNLKLKYFAAVILILSLSTLILYLPKLFAYSDEFLDAATVAKTFKNIYGDIDYTVFWNIISGATLDAPALAWNPSINKLQIAVRARDGTNMIYTATFNSNGNFENNWRNISGKTLSAPALAWNPVVNKLQIVVRGTDAVGTLYAATFNSQGVFENNWTTLALGKTPSVPALAWNPVVNKMYLVARGSDGYTIYVATFNSQGTFEQNWKSISGKTIADPTVAWNSLLNKLQIVVKGADNRLFSGTFNSQGVFENNWVAISNTSFSDPRLIWNPATGKMHLIARDANNALFSSTFNSQGVFENNWLSLSCASPSAIGIAWLPLANKFKVVTRAADESNNIWATDFDAKTFKGTFDSGFVCQCKQAGLYCQDLLRIVSNHALAYAFLYKLENDQKDLDKAVYLLRKLTELYSYWQSPGDVKTVSLSDDHVFLNAIGVYNFGLASWIIRDKIDSNSQFLIKNIIISEANKFLNSEPISGAWGINTKAESNASVPALLTMAAYFYPNEPNAANWIAKARCFAYHSITIGKDEPCCGKKTITAFDNGTAVGIFRSSNATFYLDYDGDQFWSYPQKIKVPIPSGLVGQDNDRIYNFGLSGDLPISGDWNGDGISQIGVYRPSNGRFYLDLNNNGLWEDNIDLMTEPFGSSIDLPVIGDWNGDKKDDLGVFRIQNGQAMFYLDFNGDKKWDAVVDKVFQFGNADDLPVAGKWNNSTKDFIGIYSRDDSTFYLDWNGDYQWNPAVDKKFYFKPTNGSNIYPLAGDWNDNGKESVALFDTDSAVFYFDWDDDFTWNSARDMLFKFGQNGDRPVAGIWVKREKFWIADHFFRPNPTYTASPLVLFMDSFLVYKKSGWKMPPEFSHNVLPLWGKLKEYLNPTTFEWVFFGIPWKDDWNTTGLTREVSAAAYMCLAMNHDCELEKGLLRDKATQANDFLEEKVTKQTQFVAITRALTLNSNAVKRYIETALAHDDGNLVLPSLPLTVGVFPSDTYPCPCKDSISSTTSSSQ